jgi:SPP1 family predicted phage head-tail adaptor
MRSGTLRDRVTIERAVEGKDTLEAPTLTWVEVQTVWANVQPSSGREFFGADTVEAQTTHRITMRYIPDVNNKYRLLFKDRVLEIISIINVGELNKKLDLLCREVIGK